MKALEFMYFVVYATSASREAHDLRFNPAAMIVLLIQPVINASLRLGISAQYQHAWSTRSEVLYARYDIWTYAALLLSGLVAWKLFDARRKQILSKYADLNLTKMAKMAIFAFALLCAIMNFYFYSVSHLLTVIAFVALLCVSGGLVAKFAEKQQ